MSDSSYAWKRFVQLKFGVDTADVQAKVQGAAESIASSVTASMSIVAQSVQASNTELGAVARVAQDVANELLIIPNAIRLIKNEAISASVEIATKALDINMEYVSTAISVASATGEMVYAYKALDSYIPIGRIAAQVIMGGVESVAISGIALSAAAAAAVTAVVALDAVADAASRSAMQLSSANTSSGLTASSLRAIADASGLTASQIDKATTAAAAFASTANGAGKLDSIGISQADFLAAMPEDRLKMVSAALSQYSSESKKAALATEIFGADGEKMLGTMESLSAGALKIGDDIKSSTREQVAEIADMGNAYVKNWDDISNGFSIAVKPLFGIIKDIANEIKLSFEFDATPIAESLIPIFYELSAVIKEASDAVLPAIYATSTAIREFFAISKSDEPSFMQSMINGLASGITSAGQSINDGLSYAADAMHGFYLVSKIAIGGVITLFNSVVDVASQSGEIIALALKGDISGAADAGLAMVKNQKAIYSGFAESTDASLMSAKSWGTSMREIVDSARKSIPKTIQAPVLGAAITGAATKEDIATAVKVDPKVLAALAALEQKAVDVGKALALMGVQQDAAQNEALNTLKIQSDTDYQGRKLELAQRTYEIERDYIVQAMDANNKAMADQRLGQEEIYKIGQKQLDLGMQLAKAEQTLGAATTSRWIATQQSAEKARAEVQGRLDLEIEAGAAIEKSSVQYLQSATEKVAKETFLAGIANESAATQKLLSTEYDIQLATKKELEKIAVSGANKEDKALAAERVRNAESVAMAGASAAAAREQAAGLETMVSGVLTTIVTDGDAAWKKLGESFGKHVMSQLIAMASKAFVVNIVGNVSVGGGGGSGGGVGNSLMSMGGKALSGVEVGGATLGTWGGGISSGFTAGLGGKAASFMGPTLPGFEAGAMLGEAIPYVGGAIAAYKIIDSFSDKNEKKGGNYAYDVASGAVTQGITGTNGVELGNAQSQTLIQDGIKAATATTNAILKAAGSSVTVLGGEGMAQWSSEKPESYAGAYLKTSTGVVAGKSFAEVDNNLGMADMETVIKKYAQSLNEATADAIIKVTDIPESAKTAISKIDTTLGAEAFAGAVKAVIETSRMGALAIERFGESGAAVTTQLAAAWLGFDAAGLGKMMTDAAFNPAVGMSAAETFGLALGNSVQQSLLNNVMGQVQAGIYNSIVLPILAGQEVSQAATDAVVNDAVSKLDKLAALLDSESFKGVIDRIAQSTAPVLASLAQFAPVQHSIAQFAPTAATAMNTLSTAVKEITPAEKAAEESLRNLNNTLGGLADKNASLQVDLLRAQGDDAAATALQRQQDLARLTAGMGEADAKKVAGQFAQNAALEDQIAAVKTQKTAADEAKKATDAAIQAAQKSASEAVANQQKIAEEAKSAAKTMLESWQTITSTLEDEVERIRGVMSAGTAESVAALQAKFITATAAARAGDAEAAKSLPGISQALLQAADDTMTDASRLAVLRGQVAASLEQTATDARTSARQRYDSAVQAADSFQFLQSTPTPVVQEYTPITIATPIAAPPQTSPAPAIDKPLQAMADAITVLTDTLTNRPITVRSVDY